MRLKELVYRESEAIGGFGLIECEGHRYDRHFAVFGVRHAGAWNFTDKLGHYNVCLYAILPKAWREIVVTFRPTTMPRDYETCGPAIIGLPQGKWLKQS